MENPYETPQTPYARKPTRRHLLTLVLLILLSVPAGAVASVTTCGAVFGINENLGFVIGPIVGVGVTGLIIYSAIREYRRDKGS
jgi:hypothetical protein